MKPDMTCEQCRSLLPDYAADRLNGDPADPSDPGIAVERHVTECPACQTELEEWRALAVAARRPVEPPPLPLAVSQAQLLARLGGLAGDMRPMHGALATRSVTLQPTPLPRENVAPMAIRDRSKTPPARAGARVWRLLVAAAAVLLLSAAFAQLLAPGPAGPRPTSATATAAPVALTWQSGTTPQPLPGQNKSPQVDVAPGDGDVAYACNFAPSTAGAHPTVWVTHDRAATWARVADIPLARGDIRSCDLVIDRNSSTVAVALVIGDGGVSHANWFATFDGGASWQQLAPPADGMMGEFASWHGRIYASIWGTDYLRLEVSIDQMHTWQRVDAPLEAQGFFSFLFLLAQSDGELAVWAQREAGAQREADGEIFLSHDGGASWTPLRSSMGHLKVHAKFAGVAPTPGHPWRFCGSHLEEGVSRAPLALDCTLDGGVTWREYAGVDVKFDNHGKGTETFLDILQDGSLVGAVQTASQGPGGMPPTSADSLVLYRIPPNGHAWQKIDQLQFAGILGAPTPHGDVLWLVRYPYPGADQNARLQISTARFPA